MGLFGSDDEVKEKKYKFKHFKPFLSGKWEGFNRIYQRTFEEGEVDYIYIEIAFYNILFDEYDWNCNLKYVLESNGKELTSFEKEVKVPKADNIFKDSFSWGTPDKTFWTKGQYVWKVYIDDVFIAENMINVNNKGKVTPQFNPYFNVQSLKFYNSPKADYIKPADRLYLTQFKTDNTGYIAVEFNISSKSNEDETIELICHYKDSANRIIGKSERHSVMRKKSTHQESFLWGNTTQTFWSKGQYSVDILFNDVIVASAPFKVGDVEIKGETKWHKTSINGTTETLNKNVEINTKSLKDLLEELDQLIGLNSIKTQIKEHVDYVTFEQMRLKKGLTDAVNLKLHTVLMGNPGTGKTTVAKKLGAIYKAMGLLSSGHVHEVDRADLVGEYIGKTAPRTKKEIEKARGGILFIDEAYGLFRKDTDNDFGQEVVEILLKEMSDGNGDLMIVMAGYPNEMNEFIASNPGLKSRIQQYYNFPDYLPEELIKIADYTLKKQKLQIADDARAYLLKKVTLAYRERNETFGNARYVNSLIAGAKMNMASRLIKHPNTEKLSDKQLSTITLEDVQELFITEKSKKANLPIDENLLKSALNELNELIGLQSVKQEIKDLVKLVKYYKEIGKEVQNQFVLHTVFTGNPGTGKTTVARIFAKLFKGLGILERGHLVEVDRAGLVANYIGQTASKTNAVIDNAQGGVLFIDEAYSLANKADNDFGKEAISTLLKRMEDASKDFILIVAGYPHNMDDFLNSNPGLRSRFEKTLKFEDYNANELFDIIELMLFKDDLTLNDEAKIKVKTIIETMIEQKSQHFGNAREVRKMAQQISRDHSLRLADMPKEERTIDKITTIIADDIDETKFVSDDNQQQGGIGFKF